MLEAKQVKETVLNHFKTYEGRFINFECTAQYRDLDEDICYIDLKMYKTSKGSVVKEEHRWVVKFHMSKFNIPEILADLDKRIQGCFLI